MARRLQGFLIVVATIAAVSLAHAQSIKGQGLTLAAPERPVHVTLFKAPGDAPRPKLLLLHGAGGFGRQLANYNRFGSDLAQAGFDAYLVYYYSDADQRSMDAGQDVFETRYTAWAKLVDDLADSLAKQKDSNGRVGLIGFSNGAILASGASGLDANIGAAVIYYGAEPWPLKTPIKHWPPLLILHGDADQVINVSAGKELATAAKRLGGPVELVIYSGESHGFAVRPDDKNATDAQKRALAFLKQNLQAK